MYNASHLIPLIKILAAYAKHQDAQTEAIRVTLIGIVLDRALGVGKIIGGVFTSSFELVADGLHSLIDAATDIFVLIIARSA